MIGYRSRVRTAPIHGTEAVCSRPSPARLVHLFTIYPFGPFPALSSLSVLSIKRGLPQIRNTPISNEPIRYTESTPFYWWHGLIGTDSPQEHSNHHKTFCLIDLVQLDWPLFPKRIHLLRHGGRGHRIVFRRCLDLVRHCRRDSAFSVGLCRPSETKCMVLHKCSLHRVRTLTLTRGRAQTAPTVVRNPARPTTPPMPDPGGTPRVLAAHLSRDMPTPTSLDTSTPADGTTPACPAVEANEVCAVGVWGMCAIRWTRRMRPCDEAT